MKYSDRVHAIILAHESTVSVEKGTSKNLIEGTNKVIRFVCWVTRLFAVALAM